MKQVTTPCELTIHNFFCVTSVIILKPYPGFKEQRSSLLKKERSVILTFDEISHFSFRQSVGLCHHVGNSGAFRYD